MVICSTVMSSMLLLVAMEAPPVAPSSIFCGLKKRGTGQRLRCDITLTFSVELCGLNKQDIYKSALQCCCTSHDWYF